MPLWWPLWNRSEQSPYVFIVSPEKMFHQWNASGTHSRAFIRTEENKRLLVTDRSFPTCTCSVECPSDQRVGGGLCAATEHSTTEDAFSTEHGSTFHEDVGRESAAGGWREPPPSSIGVVHRQRRHWTFRTKESPAPLHIHCSFDSLAFTVMGQPDILSNYDVDLHRRLRGRHHSRCSPMRCWSDSDELGLLSASVLSVSVHRVKHARWVDVALSHRARRLSTRSAILFQSCSIVLCFGSSYVDQPSTHRFRIKRCLTRREWYILISLSCRYSSDHVYNHCAALTAFDADLRYFFTFSA